MQISRKGTISFGDASFSIMEEVRGSLAYEARSTWTQSFKSDVFRRILQQLKGLGWSCRVPQDMVKDYGRPFANNNRLCANGDLIGELRLSGRCIEFQMYQAVNTPTRSDHNGKYESHKEAIMPYLLRLEMERTRRRIRAYFCRMFSEYTFSDSNRDPRGIACVPGKLTAQARLQSIYDKSSHFKGDLSSYKITDHNSRSADMTALQHGQRVWGFDWHGRAFTGFAYYNINNMWWVITGKYAMRNVCASSLYTRTPHNLREKRNGVIRRNKLEAHLAQAVKGMEFDRAKVLRDLLWPAGTQLFLLWSKEHNLYHRTGFLGYTTDAVDAGKFTFHEVANREGDRNKIVPLAGERSMQAA